MGAAQQGQTIVVSPTTDEWGNVYSVAVATVYTSATASTAHSSRKQSAITSIPTSLSSTPRRFYTVTQGKVLDYSSYQSSVTAALDSDAAVAYAKYTSGSHDTLAYQSAASGSARPYGLLLAIGVAISFRLGVVYLS
ncbi:hypothetical protein I317_03715 [Kwoniella heveanensis CBS 569]|uniref:Uncharacterized protein n=1 Tax=Kwoniella heveanensis BCC8398 TaxID=1296120 RepID=A0A1B9GQ86_9TREE|nr:hypothetical protein I316_04963 [Kwoniella heveanensis BCC8398]OCF42470.1 hypothetical protein I317_03715 [Kwoniella heveanensis CBS 569]